MTKAATGVESRGWQGTLPAACPTACSRRRAQPWIWQPPLFYNPHIICKVSSTAAIPTPSSNMYLCPASLPRHHSHSSSLGPMNPRQLPPSGSLEIPLCGWALLTPFPFSSVPSRYKRMCRCQEVAHVALGWASTHPEPTPQPGETGMEESLHGAVALACSEHRRWELWEKSLWQPKGALSAHVLQTHLPAASLPAPPQSLHIPAVLCHCTLALTLR